MAVFQFRMPSLNPLLLDINIYYRILKASYSLTHFHLNLPHSLHYFPPVFGVWHAYSHCVRRTCAMFLTLWSCLEYPTLMEGSLSVLGVRVYNFPKLVTLEHLAAGLLLVSQRSEVAALLRATVERTRQRHADTHWPDVARSLELLIMEYVPALFHLGKRVRDLYWVHRQPYTGHHALIVL